MKTRDSVFLLTVPLLLAACAATPPRSTPAPIVRSGSAPQTTPRSAPEAPPPQDDAGTEVYAYRAPPPGIPSGRAQNSAVVALLANAEQKRQAGDLTAAVATVERALRIEPKNARLWNRLANLRYQQQHYGMAVDLATRSNSLAAGERALQHDNWHLIARARRAQGDTAGARAAELKLRDL